MPILPQPPKRKPITLRVGKEYWLNPLEVAALYGPAVVWRLNAGRKKLGE